MFSRGWKLAKRQQDLSTTISVGLGFFNWKSSIKLVSIQVDPPRKKESLKWDEVESSLKSHYLQCGRVFGVHFISFRSWFLGNFAADVSTTAFIMLKIARRIEIHAIKIYLKTKLRGMGKRLFPSFCDIIYELFYFVRFVLVLLLLSPTFFFHFTS